MRITRTSEFIADNDRPIHTQVNTRYLNFTYQLRQLRYKHLQKIYNFISLQNKPRFQKIRTAPESFLLKDICNLWLKTNQNLSNRTVVYIDSDLNIQSLSTYTIYIFCKYFLEVPVSWTTRCHLSVWRQVPTLRVLHHIREYYLRRCVGTCLLRLAYNPVLALHITSSRPVWQHTICTVL